MAISNSSLSRCARGLSQAAIALRLLRRDLVIASDYVLVTNSHPLYLHALLHAHGCVVQLDQVRQRLNDELSVKGMLRDRVVPQPEHFELLAILKTPDLEEIRNLVLS